MSDSILFLRADDNTFESFITDRIRARGYTVSEPYSVTINEIYYLSLMNKILYKSGIPFIYKSLIGDWKKTLSDYGTVIIFDKALTVQLVKYIHTYNPDCKILIWLWNCRPLEKEILQYASVYTFDKEYAELNGYSYLPQFHFKEVFTDSSTPEAGVYYAGYDKDRFEELEQISNTLSSDGIRHRLILRKDNNKEYKTDSSIELIDNDLDYREILKDIQNYTCILELVINEQKGLTLRSLESLFGNRKLITNNKAIRAFDFYTPENIYILNENNPYSLNEFIQTDCKPVDPKICEEYTFETWIQRITGNS